MIEMCVSGGFILFDIASGFIKAWYKKDIDSTVLRKGLFHKLSELLALVGSYLLMLATSYINLGIELPLLAVVSVYICTMELVSIIENICEVNPHMFGVFSPYLNKLKQKGDT